MQSKSKKLGSSTEPVTHRGIVARIGSYAEGSQLYGAALTNSYAIMFEGDSRAYEVTVQADDSQLRKRTLALTSIGDSIEFVVDRLKCLSFMNRTLDVGPC